MKGPEEVVGGVRGKQCRRKGNSHVSSVWAGLPRMLGGLMHLI